MKFIKCMQNLKTANKFFESVAKLKYLETNKIWIHEEMKTRLNVGNPMMQFRILCLSTCYLKIKRLN